MKSGLPSILRKLFQDRSHGHSPQPLPPIRVGDCKHNFPLAEQRTVGVPQRVTRVVNAGSLRGSAVQFDDLEVAAFAQGFLRGVSYVEASDEETGDGL